MTDPTSANSDDPPMTEAALMLIVEANAYGEPLLRGTNIPVYRVAALVRAEPDGRLDLSEAVIGFPSLTKDQITTAWHYSQAYPNKGKSYPARSLKSMLAEIEFPEIDDKNP